MSEREYDYLMRVADAIDDFATLDLACLGVSQPLYTALQRRQPGPMCLGAADFMLQHLPESQGLVIIATGFPMGGGVPETDGPIGAAMLARALHLSRGCDCIIITDKGWEEPMRAACIGAGLAPIPVPEQGIETINYLKPAYIATVPREDDACHEAVDALLARKKPDLLIAIERPGKNVQGVYHGMNGRPLTGFVADLDYLFHRGRESGVPILGIGDGGNEIGMGLLLRDLPDFLPQARDCGCPCKGGTAAALSADHLVTASVSNWGATCIVAALALRLQNIEILHEPEQEQRAIELCANTGAVDGVSVSPIPAVDGIPGQEWAGLLRSLRGMVARSLFREKDWRRTVHK